jgi:ParB-like nuclease domain
MNPNLQPAQFVEHVPVETMERFRVPQRYRQSPEEWSANVESMRQGGVHEPLVMNYHPEKEQAELAEGHHRLAQAKEAGLTHVPVRVERFRSLIAGTPVAGFQGDEVPEHLKPSQIGLR